MSAPATLMFDQIKSILTTAVTSIVPGATVQIGQPQDWATSIAVLAYFWHNDQKAKEFAGPSVVRYTHEFPIHILIRNTGTSDEQVERTKTDLDAAISDAFYNNRRLNATAATSTFRQGDGKQQTGAMYVTHKRMEYRHHFFTLSASENRTYSYVNG
jgi:hypothetical protein